MIVEACEAQAQNGIVLGLNSINTHIALIILSFIRSNETNMEPHKEGNKNAHIYNN